MEVFRTPRERFAHVPGFAEEPARIMLGDELEGLGMAYTARGAGAPFVLLHGEPTWGYLYRKMIPSLSKLGTVIAPDFIGFGRSDKVTDRRWYSYDRHTRSLHQLLAALDLWDITLVVQDWGGPIGLRVAVESPERFARLVILNTALFRGKAPSPAFLAWRTFAKANPDLPVGKIVQGGTATDLSPEVEAAYDAPFPTPESKAGAAAFPLIVPLSADDPGAAAMTEVHEQLKGWEKPVLVAFSDSDPIFPPQVGERWAERIPGAVPFALIRGASHFLQEDRGEEIADHIAAFVRSS